MLRFMGMKSGNSITCGSLSGSEADAAPGANYVLACAPPGCAAPPASCQLRMRRPSHASPAVRHGHRFPCPRPADIDFSYGVQTLTNAWTIAQIIYTMVAQSSISPS